MKLNKIVVVPGNGIEAPRLVKDSNFYGWLETELNRSLKALGRDTGDSSVKVVLPTPRMPDPLVASKDKWMSFIVNELGADENTILIGHSSGAVAAMRLMEQQKFGHVILVSAYTSHLDCQIEKQSGYFDEPWNWSRMLELNGGRITQFGSEEDHLLPFAEQQTVAKKLNLTRMDNGNMTGKFNVIPFGGHFIVLQFPQLLQTILKLLV